MSKKAKGIQNNFNKNRIAFGSISFHCKNEFITIRRGEASVYVYVIFDVICNWESSNEVKILFVLRCFRWDVCKVTVLLLHTVINHCITLRVHWSWSLQPQHRHRTVDAISAWRIDKSSIQGSQKEGKVAVIMHTFPRSHYASSNNQRSAKYWNVNVGRRLISNVIIVFVHQLVRFWICYYMQR